MIRFTQSLLALSVCIPLFAGADTAISKAQFDSQGRLRVTVHGVESSACYLTVYGGLTKKALSQQL